MNEATGLGQSQAESEFDQILNLCNEISERAEELNNRQENLLIKLRGHEPEASQEAEDSVLATPGCLFEALHKLRIVRSTLIELGKKQSELHSRF